MKHQYKEAAGTYLYELVHKSPTRGFNISFIFQKTILVLLRALSFIYYILVEIKISLYKYGFLKRHELSCPVISLGNITLGGTGKTPAAKKLAAIIKDMGLRVVILNRGYRANFKGQVGLVSDGEKIYMTAAQAGDEAYLLAKSLPGVMVVIGRDRVLSGRYAVDELKAQVIIMDDGYQHWRLKRDLDIVLVDTLKPFGNQYILPRGTLREPLKNLDRADVFLLTKVNYNHSYKQEKPKIKDMLEKYNNKAFIVESNHTPGYFINIKEWRDLASDKAGRNKIQTAPDLQNERTLSFSAIGNPASFVRTLELMEINVALNIAYPDHHEYTATEMQEIIEKAANINASALITTEKDAVKIPAEFIDSSPIPLYVLPIEIEFYDGYHKLLETVEDMIRQFYER